MKSSISALFAALALAALGMAGSAAAQEHPSPANPGAFIGVHPLTAAGTPSCIAGFRLAVIDPGHFTCTSAPAACPLQFRLDNSSVRMQGNALTYDCASPNRFPK